MLIKIDSNLYPKEAIISTCYTFIDRAYIFLDKDAKKNIIKVSIKPKNRLAPKQAENLRLDFLNELLYSTLRSQIGKNNKKIRELILGRALFSDSVSPAYDPLALESTYQDDPLGIAIPWEEKYGKKTKK